MLYFNPQGPRGPRRGTSVILWYHRNFNPQGPRGPRLVKGGQLCMRFLFQSTRPSRASTMLKQVQDWVGEFQSTRPSRASTFNHPSASFRLLFQSTRPSRASTFTRRQCITSYYISIHKALAGLDCASIPYTYTQLGFQSTRPSRAST